MYKTIEKAIEMLNCFAGDQCILSLGEICKKTGIEKSTASRILSTLKKHGCLEKEDRRHGFYRIGYRIHFWNTCYDKQDNLLKLAKPVMKRLRDECGEAISLYTIEGYRRIGIAKIESIHEIGRVFPLGQYLPMHAGASGRVLLAFLPIGKKTAILKHLKLEQYTPNTICTRDKLEESMADIQEKGYGISLGEREEGAFSVTAPIKDGSGFAIASVTISGPIFRLNKNSTKKYIQLVTKAACDISKRLGFLDNDLKLPNVRILENNKQKG